MQFLKYRLNQYLIIITSFVAINSSIATLLKVLFILINFIFFINWYSKNKNDFFIKLLKLLMSKRYSGKSFKDSSVSKKPKLSLKEKRKIKKEKAKKS